MQNLSYLRNLNKIEQKIETAKHTVDKVSQSDNSLFFRRIQKTVQRASSNKAACSNSDKQHSSRTVCTRIVNVRDHVATDKLADIHGCRSPQERFEAVLLGTDLG